MAYFFKTKPARKLPPFFLIEAWKRRVDINKDVHVAISGDEGEGKSNLAIFFLKKFGIRKADDIYNHIVYTNNSDEFYDKYELLDKGEPLVFDEALDILNRADWYKDEMKKLISKVRAGVRKEKNPIFIYNVQLFRDLHHYWRTHRIRYWIELMPREWFKSKSTWCLVLKRDRMPFITGKRDTWLLDEMEKMWIKNTERKPITPQRYLELLRAHPFYKGEFRVKHVGETYYKKYLKGREKALITYVERAIPTGAKIKKAEYEFMIRLGKAITIFKEEHNKSIEEIAGILNISKNTAYKYMNAYKLYSDISK